MKIKTLITSLLLVGSLYSQSDVKRMFLHDDVKNVDFTRRYSSYSLAFKSPLCCEGDTIWVSVFSDSVDVNWFTFNLYVYFPRNINPLNSTMVLEYTDGTNEILYQIGFPDENNYVEYYVVTRMFESLFTKKVKNITFRGIQTFKIKDKTFFIDFHNKIK